MTQGGDDLAPIEAKPAAAVPGRSVSMGDPPKRWLVYVSAKEVPWRMRKDMPKATTFRIEEEDVGQTGTAHSDREALPEQHGGSRTHPIAREEICRGVKVCWLPRLGDAVAFDEPELGATAVRHRLLDDLHGAVLDKEAHHAVVGLYVRPILRSHFLFVHGLEFEHLIFKPIRLSVTGYQGEELREKWLAVNLISTVAKRT